MIGKINFKNTAENLGIIIIALFVGGAIGYFASTKANEQVLNQLIPTIEKAIDKETIKNEIINEINIDKIKKSDSIRIILDPINNQQPTNTINKKLSRKEKRRKKKSLEN